MLDGQLAGQVAWWLPLALAGLVLAALRERMRFSLPSRRLGGETAQHEIAEWVRANGTLVDPARWRASPSPTGAMRLYELYDLRR